ncbi:MAG: response regulator transcription factor [Anaerolineales bacterium]|nr:response regulator transcription factor [Anaerolineales bacterium]
MASIRLLLVDDHDVVRSGLRMLLEDEADLVILGEAGNGHQALELAAKLEPDVVIMDITLPDMSGIEVTRRIKQSHPKIAVVALTIHEDQQYFFEMLQVGASAYVPKRAAPNDLIAAIRAAYRGDMYIYPSLAKLLVSDFLSRAGDGDEKATMNGLTPREQEVLSMLAEGKTNDEIAAALTISRHTVARHRENLMGKLGLHNRSELVKYAIRKSLIKP